MGDGIGMVEMRVEVGRRRGWSLVIGAGRKEDAQEGRVRYASHLFLRRHLLHYSLSITTRDLRREKRTFAFIRRASFRLYKRKSLKKFNNPCHRVLTLDLFAAFNNGLESSYAFRFAVGLGFESLSIAVVVAVVVKVWIVSTVTTLERNAFVLVIYA